MRRAVHGLLAVAMMAGMSLALAGALAAVMSEMSETASRDARCAVWRADLHRTGGSTAYAAVSASDLGSGGWTSATASFEDDGGAEAALQLSGGGTWSAAGPVQARISAGEEYLVVVRAYGEDGSESLCTRLARAR